MSWFAEPRRPDNEQSYRRDYTEGYAVANVSKPLFKREVRILLD